MPKNDLGEAVPSTPRIGVRRRALLLLAGIASLAIILLAGPALAAPPNVVLGFATPVIGTIADADGQGTGFTGVLPNTAGNQYVPANIDRTGSELRITTTAGDINANTQQNALFSTFDGTASYSVGATLVGPLGLSAGSQSAGIFVGPDQQNNVKLVAGRSSAGVYRIQLQREVNGTATPTNVTLPAVQTATRIDLTLEVNPATDAVTGRYSVNGGPASAVSTTLPGIGTAADKAGVITTNAGTTTPITARYDSFVIEPGSSALFQARRIIIDQSNAPSSWHLPTSLTKGPDGRLWVAGMNGRIYIFNIDEDYDTTQQRVELNLWNRPNFAFDGVTPAAPEVRGRMLTGMVFGPESTPDRQVLYVTHSDPQIYIKNVQPGESPIDPASGMITRFVFDGDANLLQVHDMVTGLPRSSENHGLTGLVFGPDGWLYVGVGSNTNFGEQSLFFGYYPEVPLSAAIVRVNPTALGAGTVTAADDDTIDAEVGSRFSWVDPCNVAAGETVGNGCSDDFTLMGSAANNGTVPGEFEIYATGFRNPYDLIWHSNGKLYVNDNEGNSGFGLASVGPGVGGTCTGTPYDPADAGDPPDELYLVQSGQYHGFPNPTRNQCGWGTGVQPIATYHVHSSTNGIAEYTADTFDGLLQGQLLSVNYAIGDSMDRIRLSADGNSVAEKQTLVTGFTDPLDVIVDEAGSLIVAEHGGFPGKISVIEPVPGASASCSPLGPALDTDGDGYTDRDEIDNGTSRCNPASSPPDFDGDGASDMNDADDDNDGTPDASDSLQFDASNGGNTTLPFSLLFNNSNVGGFFGTGFHGVQPSSNGGGPVVGLVGAGGAGGYMQVVAQPGTMQGAANSAVNAMQEGFDATDPFTASLFIGEPFQDGNPQAGEAGGVFFGPGEDNYVHLAVHANNGSPIIELGTEVNGTFTRNAASPALPLPQSFVKVYLDGDPATDTVRARYQLGNNPIQTIGTVAVPGSWFGTPGLAGVYTTRAGSPNAQRTFILDDFVIEPWTPGGGGDTTPPSLTGRTPAVNATGVAVGSNVTATFDEALAPASVTTSSVTLTPTAGGAAIPAAVSLGSGNSVVTLNPNADLAAGTQYTATLSTAVEDVAGNNLASAISWSFTTASAGGGSGAFLPSGGVVVMEAESAPVVVAAGGKSWSVVSSPAGFVGSGLMESGPDTGGFANGTGGAEVRFPVVFPGAGTWHVW
ncbi:MAG: Ig-like domain-containing protein, partial [Thermoleophilia bacterium]